MRTLSLRPRNFPIRWLALACLLEVCFLSIRHLGDLRQHVVETIGLSLASGIFYLISCYQVTQPMTGPGAGVVLAAGLIFRLTVFPIYPNLSDDLYRYRWEGQLQAAGGNPYHVRPNDPEWLALRDTAFTKMSGRDFKAVYGPLTEMIERGVYSVVARFEPDPQRQVFWFKAPAALFETGLFVLILILLRAWNLPLDRGLIYGWSPLPVMEFWASGHNDAIAMFFIGLGLLAFTKRRTAAIACLTLASAAKLWPAFLYPAWISSRWRTLWVVPPILAVCALPYFDSRWPNLLENIRFISGYLSGWRNSDSLFGAVLWASGGDPFLAKRISFGLVAVIAIAVTALRWPVTKATIAILCTLLLLSANCHPWYVAWLTPLVVFHPWPPLLLWTVLMPIGHAVVIRWEILGEWDGSTPLRWLIYAPVFGLALGSAIARLVKRI